MSVQIVTFSNKIIYPFHSWISAIYTATNSATCQMSCTIHFYWMLQAYVYLINTNTYQLL